MTPSTSSAAARAPSGPNKSGGDAAEVIVRDGAILCWADGMFGPQAPSTVWCEWLGLTSSPFPASCQRATALRKALDQIGYLQ